VLNRLIAIQKLPTVRKRIRRNVHNTHDLRALA